MPPMVKSIQLIFVCPPVSLWGVPSGRPDSANPPFILMEDCLEDVTALNRLLMDRLHGIL